MSQSHRYLKLLIISTAAGIVWGGGCLVDNFWVDKWSEIVNRAIFGVINAVITGAPSAI